jgi:hypothetical protein
MLHNEERADALSAGALSSSDTCKEQEKKMELYELSKEDAIAVRERAREFEQGGSKTLSKVEGIGAIQVCNMVRLQDVRNAQLAGR